MRQEVPPEKLRRFCQPEELGFKSTEELTPLEGILGQERAVQALRFGLEIKEQGFNVYVSGLPGTGRATAVRAFLEELAKNKPVPPDWCYVNNFKDPYCPRVLRLPPGRGRELQADMKRLIEGAQREIPRTFESEDYNKRKEQLLKSIQEQKAKLWNKMQARAQEEGFALQSTPTGLFIIPALDGKPLTEEEFATLSEEAKADILEKRKRLETELQGLIRQGRVLERKAQEEVRKLDREVALFAIQPLMEEIREKYQELPEVLEYLQEVQEDLVEHLEQFKEPSQGQLPFPLPGLKELPFRKYQVNLIVDNSDLKGAPVVIEINPTYTNLFGRIEREAQFGALITDFTLIKGGALHRANGGYLVLPVEEVLRNPFSWDGLKRALRNGKIVIEDAAERLGLTSTKGLMPQPIPLDAKVVLIGTPLLYHLLYTLDEDFSELFKVKADFDTRMDRTAENVRAYAAFVCALCRKEGFRHLDASAMAKVVEHGSRLAGDQAKLSTRFAEIADLVREANFWATQEDSPLVTATHVQKAIEEKIYRSNLIQERIREMIERGFILIDVDGKVVGQVNCLSLVNLGDFVFGKPTRITASIGVGREGVIDIEREAKLGGRIHSKGVMILSGYLANKYAQDKPLTLSARLVFEQSYEEVEGDSASSAEAYVLLSSLAGLPIKQGIAVTGSINQKGEIQAIGGVNEKIEGFFEVCKAKGLNGEQGVIIPRSNVQNLMLREEVVEAVKEGKFHIYAVDTVEEGIEILTGVPAGERGEDGTFPEGTVNFLVDKRLREWAKKLKEVREEAKTEEKEAEGEHG